MSADKFDCIISEIYSPPTSSMSIRRRSFVFEASKGQNNSRLCKKTYFHSLARDPFKLSGRNSSKSGQGREQLNGNSSALLIDWFISSSIRNSRNNGKLVVMTVNIGPLLIN